MGKNSFRKHSLVKSPTDTLLIMYSAVLVASNEICDLSARRSTRSQRAVGGFMGAKTLRMRCCMQAQKVSRGAGGYQQGSVPYALP